MDSKDEHLAALMALVIGMYTAIRSTLMELPVPVSLPDIESDDADTIACVKDLARAVALVEDEPIPAAKREALRRAALKWFTAWELVHLTRTTGYAPWRLDAAQMALVEMGRIIGSIESGDLDG